MQNQAYFVYKLTSPNTPKEYIGITTNPKRRMKEHKKNARYNVGGCSALYPAMRKYGTNSFVMTILKEGLNKQEVGDYEKKLISEYNTLVPNGYNICIGGES